MADNGSTVAVHYKGMLDDGSVFDSSEGRDPLEFVLGEGKVIPGFEQAVADMEVGDSKTVKIPCAEAYGERNEDMMMAVPREQVPPEITPEVGMMLQVQTPQGPMPVRVGKVTDENIMLDANHPLAGQDLTFELELVEIR
jgi:peptidylprolyl isomerase